MATNKQDYNLGGGNAMENPKPTSASPGENEFTIKVTLRSQSKAERNDPKPAGWLWKAIKADFEQKRKDSDPDGNIAGAE